MKISRKKFVALFIICGFVFLFIYNVAILSDVRGMPQTSESFFGTDSLTGWKSAVATVLYPVKLVLLGPVSFLLDLPDPPPPFVGIGVAIYWTVLAILIHFVVGKLTSHRSV